MKPKWHLLFTEVCRTWQRTPTKQQQKCKLIYVCAEFYCEQAVNHEMQLVRQRGLQQRVSWQWRRTGAGAPHKHALLTAGLIPYQSQCVGALLSFWIKSIHPFRTEINFFMCLFLHVIWGIIVARKTNRQNMTNYLAIQQIINVLIFLKIM